MSAQLERLPGEDANVVFVPMLTPSHAVDLFLGDLSRRSRSKSGRTADSYRRPLDQFTDHLGASVTFDELSWASRLCDVERGAA